ncbi:MAG: hypothetical protein U9O56_05020 [Campylobacterota bacterium]|nr:hypothetical protein [Campylobacterota bacterium]
MSYKSWHKQHAIKHKKIMDKLAHLKDAEIIDYFKYENMIKNEPDFCPLYKDGTKCHKLKELNCYFCACPNFRVAEDRSFCDIDSKDGGIIKTVDFTHQDCSKCTVPHIQSYVENHFQRDWSKAMNKTF